MEHGNSSPHTAARPSHNLLLVFEAVGVGFPSLGFKPGRNESKSHEESARVQTLALSWPQPLVRSGDSHPLSLNLKLFKFLMRVVKSFLSFGPDRRELHESFAVSSCLFLSSGLKRSVVTGHVLMLYSIP